MKNPMSSGIPDSKSRLLWLGLLSLFVVAGVHLRGQWTGHILMWDEAMELGSVRSRAAGQVDMTTNWIWRHPPLYTCFMRLCAPLQPGFDKRVEWMNIGWFLATGLVLCRFNHRFISDRVGYLSFAILAILPGAVFFDVWIKRDHPVALFSLLAFWAFASGRAVVAGALMGAAILCKEVATFYLVGLLLIWACYERGTDRWRQLLLFLVPCGLTFGWWYLWVLPSVAAANATPESWAAVVWEKVSEHFAWAAGEHRSGWEGAPLFYVRQLLQDVGPMLLLVTVIGLVEAGGFRADPHRSGLARGLARWPLWVLVPAMVLLSLLSGKVAWVVICLMPAWATLTAMGVDGMLNLFERAIVHPVLKAMAGITLILGLGVVTVLQSKGGSYEDAFRGRAEGQLVGAEHSRAAAELVNRLVEPGDTVLLSCFYHWSGLPRNCPCPVFSWYLQVPVAASLCDDADSPVILFSRIRTERPDWALLSPVEGEDSEAMIRGLESGLGVQPVATTATTLFYDLRTIDR